MKRDSVYKRVLKRILNEEFNGDFEHATKDNVDSWDARKWGNMPPWLKTDKEREEYVLNDQPFNTNFGAEIKLTVPEWYRIYDIVWPEDKKIRDALPTAERIKYGDFTRDDLYNMLSRYSTFDFDTMSDEEVEDIIDTVSRDYFWQDNINVTLTSPTSVVITSGAYGSTPYGKKGKYPSLALYNLPIKFVMCVKWLKSPLYDQLDMPFDEYVRKYGKRYI